MSRNSPKGKMTPSKENYLKVMLGLPGDGGIRSIDIANALGVSKASVSCMMKVLRDEGYVSKEKYGTVTLTESGRSAAVNIKRNYEVIERFLHNVLGVAADIAAEDACRIEHMVSTTTVDRINQQLEKLSEHQYKTDC